MPSRIDAIEVGRFIDRCKEQPSLAHVEPDDWFQRYTPGQRAAITRDLRKHGLRRRRHQGITYWEVAL